MDFEQQQKTIDEQVTRPSMGERFFNAFGPLTAGIALDLLDLATFGAWGLYLGPLFGALMGWWFSTTLKLGLWSQSLVMVLAGLYCALPSTELIPFATVVFATVRFFKSN